MYSECILWCMMRISSDVEIIIMWSTGKAMKLSPGAEEVATFYAKMLDHEYTTKDIFRKNFFKDWRKVTHFSTHYCCQYTVHNCPF